MTQTKKITFSIVGWLTITPFFILALKQSGSIRTDGIFEGFIYPLSVYIAILSLAAMTINWLANKKTNRFLVIIGFICGFPNALCAFCLSLGFHAFLLALLLVPGCALAIYLVSWNFENHKPQTV